MSIASTTMFSPESLRRRGEFRVFLTSTNRQMATARMTFSDKKVTGMKPNSSLRDCMMVEKDGIQRTETSRSSMNEATIITRRSGGHESAKVANNLRPTDNASSCSQLVLSSVKQSV